MVGDFFPRVLLLQFWSENVDFGGYLEASLFLGYYCIFNEGSIFVIFFFVIFRQNFGFLIVNSNWGGRFFSKS